MRPFWVQSGFLNVSVRPCRYVDAATREAPPDLGGVSLLARLLRWSGRL